MKKNYQTLIFIVLGGVLLFVVAVMLIGMRQEPIQLPNTTSSEEHIYTSQKLQFAVEVPSSFQVLEKLTTVQFTSHDASITVSREATSFTNLSAYLADFDSKRSTKILEEKNIQLQYLPAVERVEQLMPGKEQKVYFIYTKGWVYTVSTTDKALYETLDRSVYTFRLL